MATRKLTDARRQYLSWRISEERRKLKLKAIEYKGGCCEKCGYKKCPASLVFHHTDPSKKDYGISSSSSRKWVKIKSELDKCALLCANCHNELHNEIYKIKREETYKKVREKVPERKKTLGTVTFNCEKCNRQITRYKSQSKNRFFCSRKCSNEIIYNESWSDVSQDQLIELIKTKSAKDISIILNKDLCSVYRKIKSIRS
jgi:endogenous inhibitor of DNA gyrase (YacG/DUF329 family)